MRVVTGPANESRLAAAVIRPGNASEKCCAGGLFISIPMIHTYPTNTAPKNT